MTAIERLAQLLKQTAEQHHDAFAATDGVDPDWPQWYAGNLKPHFDELLDASLSRSEIVALLLSLDQEHRARGDGKPWPDFYAELIGERFVAAQDEKLALYHFDACPYCRLVRRAIAELGVDVELRDILAEPQWRDELVAARGRGTVPVLRCVSPDGKVRWMPESRDIVRYLRARYG